MRDAAQDKAQLRILPLDDAAIRTVYKTCMVHDFPDNERKPLHMIRAALRRDEYDCLGLFADGQRVGYAFFVRLGGLYLLDYYAVSAELRGCGYGSAFLRLLREQLSAPRQTACVLIETENPAYAEPDAREIQQRRVQFYLRAGCADTGACACVFGAQYRILEMPVSRTHSAAETAALYAQVYRSILPPLIFRARVQIVP